MWTRITPNTDIFHAVLLTPFHSSSKTKLVTYFEINNQKLTVTEKLMMIFQESEEHKGYYL